MIKVNQPQEKLMLSRYGGAEAIMEGGCLKGFWKIKSLS